MGRVLTNNVGLAYAVEQTLGVLPGSPAWFTMEPNAIKKYGADLKAVVREPISSNRQRRKGAIVDLDSSVEWDADLTMDHFINFCEGFVFSVFKGPAVFRPTAVTTGAPGSYTVPSGGAVAAGTLLYGRGFTNALNNGLQVAAAGSTGTSIKVTGLTTETPPANALLEICGVRGASGDITINASQNLTSTVLDFTTLGLTVGQSIWIGGDLSANQFATAADRGYARIKAISANLITLDKRSNTFTADTGTGKLIDLFFGRFCRNVAVSNADYIEKSYQFELVYPNLQTPGPGDMYEYAKGNFANQLGFDLPLTNKAGVTLGFIGTDTPSPTTTRATNASAQLAVLRGTAFSTTSDVARLRIQQVDETGLTTDFRSLKLTLNNNVTPEKVIAQLGAKFMNTGIFQVNLEAELIFTNSAVIDALRGNTTVQMDFVTRNQDGAILVDIPSLSITDGNRDFPVNESVKLKITGNAFADATLNTSLGVSLFPYAPAS